LGNIYAMLSSLLSRKCCFIASYDYFECAQYTDLARSNDSGPPMFFNNVPQSPPSTYSSTIHRCFYKHTPATMTAFKYNITKRNNYISSIHQQTGPYSEWGLRGLKPPSQKSLQKILGLRFCYAVKHVQLKNVTADVMNIIVTIRPYSWCKMCSRMHQHAPF